MPDDVTPELWLERLSKRLSNRESEVLRFERYYDGPHPLAFATSEYREEFERMLSAVSDNWMALVVDAAEERLHVEGFRIGEDPAGDSDAWQIWQENFLDADSELAHSTALTTSEAAVLVWWGDDDRPVITVEHPRQVIVALEPGSRRRRAAAMKRWVDEWSGRWMANVYLPDAIHKFETTTVPEQYRSGHDGQQALEGSAVQWRRRAEDDGMVQNPLGVVPIVPLVNRPKMMPTTGFLGRSEIAQVISTQDQINKLVCDLLVSSEYGAFRQRWATGIEIPKDPETGEDLEQFAVGIHRLWHVAAPDARFGDFAETDLSRIVGAIENRVQSLASRTRTPPHYLLGGSGSFPSGESLKATETGLIAKVRSRQRHFGEAWEEVIRLAFAVLGDERQRATRAETIWADPESRSEAEHTDSLLKKMSLGVPMQQLWEDAGYSPEQIGRFRRMLVDQAVLQNLATPAVPGAPVPSPMTDPDDVDAGAA